VLCLPFFSISICRQAHPNPSGNWSEWILSKLRLPNLMYEDVPNKPLDYYTCPFKASKLDK
jgi:anoctamin-7